MSYYNYPTFLLSDKAKMLLMCIDSHYLGFYNDKFHETQKKWLVDILELPELYDIILQHDISDFERLQAQYNLKNGKIWIDNDGYLKTNIDLEGISKVLEMQVKLPTYQFEQFFKEELTLKTGYANTNNIKNREQIQKNMFSYSQTYKNNASYTYLVKK